MIEADTSAIVVLVTFIFHDIMCVYIYITSVYKSLSLICCRRSFTGCHISYITNHKLYITYSISCITYHMSSHQTVIISNIVCKHCICLVVYDYRFINFYLSIYLHSNLLVTKTIQNMYTYVSKYTQYTYTV